MQENKYKNSDPIVYLLQAKLSFMLRYGMVFLLFLVMVVLVLLYFIKVPDTLEGKFVLTSNNPPKPIVSKINGRIVTKLVNDKDQVIKGQVLLVMESLANFNEVNSLKYKLKQLKYIIDSSYFDSILKIDINSLNQLGEIQSQYETFKRANNELYVAVSDRQYIQKRDLIAHRLLTLQKLCAKLKSQKTLYEQEYLLAYENFKIDSFLINIKNISGIEYRQTESALIRAQQALNNAEQALINNENSQNDINDQLLDLQVAFENQKNNFLQNFYNLAVALHDWENKFIITSPFSGYVSFNCNTYEGLQLQAGQPVFYIIPINNVLVCEIMVPQINFGKIKKNQRSILKFDSYNFEEFGVLEAYVFNISDIPIEMKTGAQSENVYMVQVAFKNSLETSYHKKIEPRYGLTGTASIILEDKSIIEKLFLDKFKALFVYQ